MSSPRVAFIQRSCRSGNIHVANGIYSPSANSGRFSITPQMARAMDSGLSSSVAALRHVVERGLKAPPVSRK